MQRKVQRSSSLLQRRRRRRQQAPLHARVCALTGCPLSPSPSSVQLVEQYIHRVYVVDQDDTPKVQVSCWFALVVTSFALCAVVQDQTPKVQASLALSARRPPSRKRSLLWCAGCVQHPSTRAPTVCRNPFALQAVITPTDILRMVSGVA